MQIPLSQRNDTGLAPLTMQRPTHGARPALSTVALKVFFRGYYPYARMLTRLMPTLTLDGKTLQIPASVYKPLENEQRYREFINPGDLVCDLGCGSGVVSVFVAEKAKHVVALDISAEAVAATQDNCRRLGIENVEAHHSDMFTATDCSFDCICANPPFVEISMEGESMQWATSDNLLNRLFREGAERLNPGGRIVALYPKRKEKRLSAFAEAAGFRLVESRPVAPKSPKIWLLCAIYMQLFFNAHFFVYERR